jgi:hypothetical protein
MTPGRSNLGRSLTRFRVLCRELVSAKTKGLSVVGEEQGGLITKKF